jgi:hypothetical protein
MTIFSQRLNQERGEFMSKKAAMLNGLFCSIIFSTVFTFEAGLIQGHIDWPTIPIQLLFGTVVGFIICAVIPCAHWGEQLGAKFAKPGSILFKIIMFSTLLIVMLTLMCPIIAFFVVCVLNKAPFSAIASFGALYGTFLPFLVTGVLILLVIGDAVMGLAIKLAGK